MINNLIPYCISVPTASTSQVYCDKIKKHDAWELVLLDRVDAVDQNGLTYSQFQYHDPYCQVYCIQTPILQQKEPGYIPLNKQYVSCKMAKFQWLWRIVLLTQFSVPLH